MTAREVVIQCLQLHPGSTSAYIAYLTTLSHGTVVMQIDQLVSEGVVKPVVAGHGDAPYGTFITYALAQETIGPCDVCGRTDHHLIEEMCPACRRMITDIGSPHGAAA